MTSFARILLFSLYLRIFIYASPSAYSVPRCHNEATQPNFVFVLADDRPHAGLVFNRTTHNTPPIKLHSDIRFSNR